MKWIDNAYCHDNGFFTGGVIGSWTDKRDQEFHVGYFAGQELGRFKTEQFARIAVERAVFKRDGFRPPLIPLGQRTGSYSSS